MNTFVHLWQYLAEFFFEWKMFHSCRKNQNTNYMFSSSPPPPPWVPFRQSEVYLMVSAGFFLLACSFLVLSVIYYGAFCLYVVTSFFCIPIIYPHRELSLVRLQSLCLCKICPSVSYYFSHVFNPCCCNSSLSLDVIVKFWYLIMELEGLVCCIVFFLFSLKFSVV